MSFFCRLLSRSRNHFPSNIPRFLGKQTDPPRFPHFLGKQTYLPPEQTHRSFSSIAKMADLCVEHRTINVNGINIHVAEKHACSGDGEAPVILFLHGFPEIWYTWRHQMAALSLLGYRTVAPDLRGYGDSDAPERVEAYTYLHLVGDVAAVIDAVTSGSDTAVFVVGHDWGAMVAWQLCLFRPEKVRALVNMSVVFSPRNPNRVPIPTLRHVFGEDFYICRFQKPGEIEAEFAEYGTERVLKEILTYRKPRPLCMPKGKIFERPVDAQIPLPSWLTEEDFAYYVSKYEKKGFTGGINYYRNLDRNWELTAPWTGAKVNVPVKFIVGDEDLTYNLPGTKDYIHGGGLQRDVPLLDEAVVMNGLGHFLHEEKPDEINQHIYDFFQKFR